jgi:hypothetical protein
VLGKRDAEQFGAVGVYYPIGTNFWLACESTVATTWDSVLEFAQTACYPV